MPRAVAWIVVASCLTAFAADHPHKLLEKAVANGDEASVARMLAAGVHRQRGPYEFGTQYEIDGRMGALLNNAVENGRLGLVRILSKYGAPYTTAYRPLTVAIYHDHLDIAEFLLAHGANPNGPGTRYHTPLMAAAERGHLRMVEILLAKGADPTVKILADNRTAYTYAIENGHAEIAGLLLAEMDRRAKRKKR